MKYSLFVATILSSVSTGAIAQTAARSTPPVSAQAAPEASDRPVVSPATPTPPVATQAPDDGGIVDIIVTATRREERLQQIPVTVTAISGDTLRSSGVIDTRQLTQVVPGLVGARNAGVNQPVIRGVGTGGVVGDESNVATYIDGVYQPDPWTTNLDLVEVQRIEVLRGPQGTLFGRNATGGLINVITPDPSFDFKGHVTATGGVLRGVGDYDIRGYVTTGLGEKVAMDFAALYKKTDNYVSNIATGEKAYGNDEYWSLRSKLLFRPSDGVKIVLTGDYAKREGGSNVYQLYENDAVGRLYPGIILPTGPWQALYNYPPHLGLERYALSLATRFDLGAVALETTGSYQHGEIAQVSDKDSSNIDLGRGEVYTGQRTFSQEVRLLSNASGPFQWLTGAYYYTSKLDGVIPTTAAGRSTPPALPPLSTKTLSPVVRADSIAVFGEGTYALFKTLFLTAGGRYTTEIRKFNQSLNGVPLFAQQRSKFDKFTYRGAVRWQFDPKANVYLTYGTGFKSGVYNGVSTVTTPTRPENLTSIEAGLKADPARWLRTNVSVFHYDYKDLQVGARDPVTNLVILQNAANAEIYGGELEVTVAPNRDINLVGKFSYLHGEYKNFPLAEGFVPNANGAGNTTVVVDASGKRTVIAPRTAFNIGANWDHGYEFGRLGASINVYHSARVFYDFTNNFSQAPYTLLNGEVSFAPAGDRLNFSLAVTNLTNAVVFSALRIGANSTDGILERPREFKASVRFDF